MNCDGAARYLINDHGIGMSSSVGFSELLGFGAGGQIGLVWMSKNVATTPTLPRAFHAQGRGASVGKGPWREACDAVEAVEAVAASCAKRGNSFSVLCIVPRR